MPFCKIHLTDTAEGASFEGYFQEGGDTIYAAINPNSPEFGDYQSLEPFDICGGRALYEMAA